MTNKEQLNLIPEIFRSLADKRIRDHKQSGYKEYIDQPEGLLLVFGFNWKYSEEGEDFWYSVNEDLKFHMLETARAPKQSLL